jgi:hypothetical protein
MARDGHGGLMPDTQLDQGMREIAEQYAGGGVPGVAVEAGVGLEVTIGRLARALEVQNARRHALDQLVSPIRIGPLDFTVTGAQPKLKAYRAGPGDISPQEGFMWFVTNLTLSGLNAGDLVNLYVTGGTPLAVNSAARHTFTGPAAVGAGLGVSDWEPGSEGLPMWPDDVIVLQSAGTLAAAELILTGYAIQVGIRVLAEYLM